MSNVKIKTIVINTLYLERNYRSLHELIFKRLYKRGFQFDSDFLLESWFSHLNLIKFWLVVFARVYVLSSSYTNNTAGRYEVLSYIIGGTCELLIEFLTSKNYSKKDLQPSIVILQTKPQHLVSRTNISTSRLDLLFAFYLLCTHVTTTGTVVTSILNSFLLPLT